MAGHILAIINNKGGVGKTTTAVNLIHGLATKGERALLVDLDSQASASLALGIGRKELVPSMSEVLFGEIDAKQAIRSTHLGSVDVIPGSMSLASADLALVNEQGREQRLGTVLKSIKEDYSWTVVDTPPSLSLLSINALVACDSFLVPIEPHYLALEGLANFLEALDRIREGIGFAGQMLGIVATKVDRRTKVASEVIAMLHDHFENLLFGTEVPINIKLAESPSFGQTIFEYDARSKGASAYAALVEELRTRVANIPNDG